MFLFEDGNEARVDKLNNSSKLWIAFGFLILTFSLLSFCSFQTYWVLLISCLGLIVPLIFTFKNPLLAFPEKSLFSVPSWLWIPIFLGAFFLRFYKLTTLSTWPTLDEASQGLAAINLMETGRFHFFYAVARNPPFYLWGLAGFFKIFSPSIFSLWAFPALISCATVLAAFWVGHEMKKPVFGLAFTLFTAFSFWPMYSGRFSHPPPLMLFWVYLALGCSIRFWKYGGENRLRETVLLAAVVGSGFYTFTAWPAAAFVFSLPLLVSVFKKEKYGGIRLVLYGAIILLLIVPLAWGSWKEGFWDYVRMVGGNGDSTVSLAGRLKIAGIYLAAPFVSERLFLNSFWGGFLNPILGALFFVGLFSIVLKREIYWVWYVTALFLLWLPGLLTINFEMYRILLLCPFFLAGASWGLSVLASSVSADKRAFCFWIILFFSAALDSYHLFVVYPEFQALPENKTTLHSVEMAKAYRLIQEADQSRGPLVLLTEFGLKPTAAFTVATYGINVDQKEDHFIRTPKYAVVLTNPNYQPFLEKIFPSAEWRFLSWDDSNWNNNLLLGFIPWVPATDEILRRWWKADQALLRVRDESVQSKIDNDSVESARRLESSYVLFQKDPFLESIYWEKMAFYDSSSGTLSGAINNLEMGLKRGYPSANLYYSLGVFLGFEGRISEARRAFGMALKAPVDRTPAAGLLHRAESGLPLF